MHLARIRIILGCWVAMAGSTAVHSAVVYKWTDADGVVHYSDQPAPGAEKIVTSTGSKGIGGGPIAPSAPETAKPKAPALAFTELAITSPGREETITGNQPISVHLAVAPELTPTQVITWFLNGSALSGQAPDAVQFTLEDLPRGTYSLSATITDQGSGDTKSVDPVTFYVVRPSVLSPQHK